MFAQESGVPIDGDGFDGARADIGAFEVSAEDIVRLGLRPTLPAADVARSQTEPYSKRSGWINWQPLTSAAIGLLVGVFSASVVWAVALPARPEFSEEIVSFMVESFEDAEIVPPRAG